MKTQKRKVLYSAGYGAGWVSWNTDLFPGDREKSLEAQRLLLEWPDLITAVEKGEKITMDHPALRSLVAALAVWGINSVKRSDSPLTAGGHYGDLCCLGIDGLTVETGYGLCKIQEYDGSESVLWKEEDDGWL